MEQSSGGRSHQLTVLGADNTEENRVVRGRGCSGTSQRVGVRSEKRLRGQRWACQDEGHAQGQGWE